MGRKDSGENGRARIDGRMKVMAWKGEREREKEKRGKGTSPLTICVQG